MLPTPTMSPRLIGFIPTRRLTAVVDHLKGDCLDKLGSALPYGVLDRCRLPTQKVQRKLLIHAVGFLLTFVVVVATAHYSGVTVVGISGFASCFFCQICETKKMSRLCMHRVRMVRFHTHTRS